MFTFLLIVHALIAAALVTVILMQRSEGGGLGTGSGPTGLMTARGAADFLTRTTAVLAVLFVAMSVALAAYASVARAPGAIDTSFARQAQPLAPVGGAPAVPFGGLPGGAPGVPPPSDPTATPPGIPAPAAEAPIAVPANAATTAPSEKQTARSKRDAESDSAGETRRKTSRALPEPIQLRPTPKIGDLAPRGSTPSTPAPAPAPAASTSRASATPATPPTIAPPPPAIGTAPSTSGNAGGGDER
jgi:preprotein translocase subunit SecG